MNELIERLRRTWDELNEREKGLVAVLAIVFAAGIFASPVFYLAHVNSELEEKNSELRSVLELIGQRRSLLLQVAETRKAATARYKHHTPPLGSFLEEQAKQHGLTVREVTDQPEKAAGNYFRRSVRASINEVGLTGIMDLLSSLGNNPNPIAVDQLQIEHYQAGDSFRLKIGILTFDRKDKTDTKDKGDGKDQKPEPDTASGG